MSLEKQQNSESQIKSERNRVVDIIVASATLAFLVAFLGKCANDFDNDPRIPIKDEQKLETAFNQNADLIVNLASLRKDHMIFEDQIYTKPKFYTGPGLKQEIIYKI